MIRLLFILFLITLSFTHVRSQNSFLTQPERVLPTHKEWTDLQVQFNIIPADKLNIIEKELDSTISASDCYKFLYNPDSTKFIAFFVMHKDNFRFDKLIHFGRAVHKHYRPSDNDSILYLGYVLWGMKYEQSWYYHKDRENEFWDRTDKSANDNFLYYILNDVGYFRMHSIESFWKKGGNSNEFRILPKGTSYLEEYIGQPELVGWHKSFEERRKNDLLNEKLEKETCSIQNDLWDTLNRTDSAVFHSRYISQYSGKSCLSLYNAARNKILIPVIYYDNKSQPWLTYYYLSFNSADTTLYRWTKISTKQITRKPGDESLEVVYDLRTFIENWNWGTVNMISKESFWMDNFKDVHLEKVN